MNGKAEFVLPNNIRKVLLHSCCAPCSGAIVEKIHKTGIEMTIFFYNPNIYPQKEYERRKNEHVKFAKKLGVKLVDGDYDNNAWLNLTRGLEKEPERGKRCEACFKMRMKRTAKYAYDQGFKVFTSSLGISRWKDFEQVSCAGKEAARLFPNLQYWEYNWRKEKGVERMSQISKEENFYRII